MNSAVEKTCHKCKVSKSIDLFNKNKACKDGLSYYCRECTKASTREYSVTITPEEWQERREARLRKEQELLARRLAKKERKQEIKEQRHREKKEHEQQLRNEERWLAFHEAIKDFKGDYRPIPENPNYIALDDGRIWTFKKCKFVSNANHRLGYLFSTRFIINGKVKLCLLHQVIAHTFLPKPPDKTELNHKDGNKHNCAVSNLEWVTRKENMNHAWDMGLMESVRLASSGNHNRNNTKLSFDIANEIRALRKNGARVPDLSKQFSLGETAIYRVINNITWVR